MLKLSIFLKKKKKEDLIKPNRSQGRAGFRYDRCVRRQRTSKSGERMKGVKIRVISEGGVPK